MITRQFRAFIKLFCTILHVAFSLQVKSRKVFIAVNLFFKNCIFSALVLNFSLFSVIGDLKAMYCEIFPYYLQIYKC